MTCDEIELEREGGESTVRVNEARIVAANLSSSNLRLNRFHPEKEKKEIKADKKGGKGESK